MVDISEFSMLYKEWEGKSVQEVERLRKENEMLKKLLKEETKKNLVNEKKYDFLLNESGVEKVESDNQVCQLKNDKEILKKDLMHWQDIVKDLLHKSLSTYGHYAKDTSVKDLPKFQIEKL